MATFDRNLGIWRASDGTAGFGSQAAAEEYEATGARGDIQGDTESFGHMYDALAAPVVRPTDAAQAEQTAIRDQAQARRLQDQQYELRRDYFKGAAPSNYGLSLDPSTAGEAASDQAGASAAANKRSGGFVGDLGRLGGYAAGALFPMGAASIAAENYLPKEVLAAIDPVGYGSRQGINAATGAIIPGGNGLGQGSSAPGVGSDHLPSAPSPGGIRTPVRPAGQGGAPGAEGTVPTDAAGAVAGDQAAREGEKQSLSDLYEESRYDGSPEAEESRRNQQAALAKQVELYDILAKFDPDAYAEKASDLAMSNELALARSQVGAAAGAEGLFQAQEQAPKIQADARRDADQQLLQKQQLAAQVTGQMGDLATNTRGQDVGEAQAKSEFGLRIADGVSQITGLDWQLDSKESQRLSDIALALDAQNIEWAKLDLNSQIAEADRILAEAGLSQQWRIFKAGQSLSEKDLYGGLLTLVGTGMTGGFGILAAQAAARGAQK